MKSQGFNFISFPRLDANRSTSFLFLLEGYVDSSINVINSEEA